MKNLKPTFLATGLGVVAAGIIGMSLDNTPASANDASNQNPASSTSQTQNVKLASVSFNLGAPKPPCKPTRIGPSGGSNCPVDTPNPHWHTCVPSLGKCFSQG